MPEPPAEKPPVVPTASTREPILEVPGIQVDKLTRKFGGFTALDEISFSIPQGEVTGFLGPNGAGKSTTMRILAGLLTATRGEARIHGVSVARHPERAKQHIGYMPEHNPLPEELRVGDFLTLRGRLKGLRGKVLKDRVNIAMDLCDLTRKARRKIIGTLSKGFRQRVGLADALLSSPDVILLDEPTIGLDPHQVRAVRELIANLQGSMTVLLSSHILAEIELNCDRVIIINQGQIVANGEPGELRETFFPGRRYQLDYRGDPERVLGALQRPGLSLQTKSIPNSDSLHRIDIIDTSGEEIGSWVAERIQIEAGASLHRLEARQPTLEDIFLAATRRTWKENQVDDPTTDTEPAS